MNKQRAARQKALADGATPTETELRDVMKGYKPKPMPGMPDSQIGGDDAPSMLQAVGTNAGEPPQEPAPTVNYRGFEFGSVGGDSANSTGGNNEQQVELLRRIEMQLSELIQIVRDGMQGGGGG